MLLRVFSWLIIGSQEFHNDLLTIWPERTYHLLAMLALEDFLTAAHSETVKVYPGHLGIGKVANLTPEQREVEARTVWDLENDTVGYLARYEAANGNYLGADNAKELFPLYSATERTRRRFVEAVHYASGALVKEIWLHKLAQPPKSFNEYVLFTAGGPGAGKTAAIECQPACRALVARAYIVHDTMLAELERGRAKIDQVLDSQRFAVVLYVYRPVESAMVGVIDRARQTGRIVTLADVARKHYESQETFIALAEAYRSTPTASFRVIDNSGPLGTAHEIPLAIFKERRVADWQTISRRAMETLDDEYRNRLGTDRELSASLYFNLRDEGIDFSKL